MAPVPLVSVCVPTIGRTKFLAQTLDTLQAQTLADFELVILDNASADEPRLAIEERVRGEPRARILRVEQRIPMFANFNRGVSAARGKYLTFCHDDDLYTPDYLLKLVGMLEQSPSAGFAGSNYDFIDETSAITDRRRMIRKSEVWPGRRYIDFLMKLAFNPIPMPGLVYRREALSAGFDESISIHWGDFVLLMRIAETRDIAMLADPVVRIRRHSGQASSFPLSTSIPARTEMLRAYCAEFRRRWPNDRDFAARLERHVPRAHRMGLLWGWLSARNESEAGACLAVLDGTMLDGALRYGLQQISRLGLRSKVQDQNGLLHWVKTIGARR
jgi:glycosyltransferase involved in cell wall biosynthesis